MIMPSTIIDCRGLFLNSRDTYYNVSHERYYPLASTENDRAQQSRHPHLTRHQVWWRQCKPDPLGATPQLAPMAAATRHYCSSSRLILCQ